MIQIAENGPASWFLAILIEHHGEKVVVHDPFPAENGVSSWFPVTGLDRNQMFRRILSRANTNLSLTRLEPGTVYHFRGKEIIRPASVEKWIVSCGESFPHPSTRDFWESIWNLSAAAWNTIDVFGKLPCRPPSPGFPYCYPSFWRGFRRNRILFTGFADFLQRLEIEENTRLREFLETVVAFVFGMKGNDLPLGLAAMALNAPCESYRLDLESPGEARARFGHPGDSVPGKETVFAEPAHTGCWKVACSFHDEKVSMSPHPASDRGFGANGPPVRMVFFEEHLRSLETQAVVLTPREENTGWVWFRAETPDSSELERGLGTALGPSWGGLNEAPAVPLPPLIVTGSDGDVIRGVFPAQWPWLGPALAVLEILQHLPYSWKDRMSHG